MNKPQHWLGALRAGWNENKSWLEQLEDNLVNFENENRENLSRLDNLLDWLLGSVNFNELFGRSLLQLHLGSITRWPAFTKMPYLDD